MERSMFLSEHSGARSVALSDEYLAEKELSHADMCPQPGRWSFEAIVSLESLRHIEPEMINGEPLLQFFGGYRYFLLRLRSTNVIY
jgi:hypothetical protein